MKLVSEKEEINIWVEFFLKNFRRNKTQMMKELKRNKVADSKAVSWRRIISLSSGDKWIKREQYT